MQFVRCESCEVGCFLSHVAETQQHTMMMMVMRRMMITHDKSKGKGFPYSLPSVGPGADPGVYRQSARK